VGTSLAPDPKARTQDRTLVHLRLQSDRAPRSSVDIDNRRAIEPTENLRHVSATCAQYGIGSTLVGLF